MANPYKVQKSDTKPSREREATEDKLELLSIRDSAERNGGVEDDHIKKALCVADKARKRMLSDLDDLVSCTNGVLSKAAGE